MVTCQLKLDMWFLVVVVILGVTAAIITMNFASGDPTFNCFSKSGPAIAGSLDHVLLSF